MVKYDYEKCNSSVFGVDSFINNYKKKKKQNTALDSSLESYILNNYAQSKMNFYVDNLLEDIEALKDQYRFPFLISYNGYICKGIQKVTGGLTLGTIKSKIHSARKTLQIRIKYRQQELAA